MCDHKEGMCVHNEGMCPRGRHVCLCERYLGPGGRNNVSTRRACVSHVEGKMCPRGKHMVHLHADGMCVHMEGVMCA